MINLLPFSPKVNSKILALNQPQILMPLLNLKLTMLNISILVLIWKSDIHTLPNLCLVGLFHKNLVENIVIVIILINI